MTGTTLKRIIEKARFHSDWYWADAVRAALRELEDEATDWKGRDEP